MQAFTPTPPPTPEHLALITEALCARARARNQAASNSTLKRREQFRQELSLLRTTLHPNPAPTTPRPVAASVASHTGAAGVLHARLNRIVPQPEVRAEELRVEEAHQSVFMSAQSREEAYHARMRKYTHTTEVSPSKSASKKSGYAPPRQLDVEHVLPAAPVRPAISSAPVVPMITSHEDAAAAENAHIEEVQRPSLVDAVVRAFSKFVERISDKKSDEEKREREGDGVVIGTAAAQVLAVLVSLGKQ